MINELRLYRDKIEHFFVSASIVFVGSLFFPLIVAVAIALIVGLWRELNKFDIWDLLADILGVILACLLLII